MEYRVASSWFCYSAGHKARKIETYLNDMAKDGWRFVALDAVTVLGFDGYAARKVDQYAARKVIHVGPSFYATPSVQPLSE